MSLEQQQRLLERLRQLEAGYAKLQRGEGSLIKITERFNLNKENFEITWDDLSSFLTEEVNHNELIGNSTNYKRGIQAVDYVTRVKDYYYLILGLGCN